MAYENKGSMAATVTVSRFPDPSGNFVCGTAEAHDVTIQRAIDHVVGLGGGVVYIGEGTYNCTASITVGTDVTVCGSKDAVLQINAAVHGIIILGQHITLSGFTVDGAGTSRVLVFIYSTAGVTTQDILIDNMYLMNNNSDDAVYVGNEEYPAYDVVVRRCFASNIARHAYSVTSGVNILFHHNFYTGVVSRGLSIETNGRTPPEVIENIIFQENIGDSATGGVISLDVAEDQGDIIFDGNIMTCDGSDTGFQISEGRTEVVFINNVIDGAGGNGALYLQDMTDVLVKNNRFKNFAANTRGVWIRNVERLWFIDNEILDATLDGIVVAPNVSANAIRIEGNKVVASVGVGINLASGTVTDIEVNDNLISTPSNYGIYCNIAGAVLNGNTIDSNTSQINIRVLLDRCKVINNKIRNSDQVGIRVDSDYNTISENKIINCTLQGIYIYGNNNFCYENDVDDTSHANKIHLQAGATGNHVWKNFGLTTLNNLLDGGTDTAVQEIFCRVTDPTGNLGNHPVVTMPDDTDTYIYDQISVPLDFQSLVTVQIIVVQSTGANPNMVWTCDTDWGKLCSGEDYLEDSDTTGATSALAQDDLVCLDISAALTGIAGGDLIGVSFMRDGDNLADTINGPAYYLGIRVRYV